MKLFDSAGKLHTWPQLAAALSRKRAKFGPRRAAAMEQQAALSRLEPVLGKILNSKLEFKWDPDSGNMVSPDWMATVEVLQPGGGHLCYALFYEVFDGRLTGLLAYLPGTRPWTKPDEC